MIRPEMAERVIIVYDQSHVYNKRGMFYKILSYTQVKILPLISDYQVLYHIVLFLFLTASGSKINICLGEVSQ